MPRIKMKRELFEIRTICALISQKKIIIMKIQKSIFTLFVFAASTIFAGCNTDQFDVAPEKKIAYTDSEKAQIYALAEKYELEVVPMKQSKNQSLKSVSELEETFKAIYKQNNTKIPLFKTKDGSYTTKRAVSPKRLKSRNEGGGVHKLYAAVISNYELNVYANVSLTTGEVGHLGVQYSNVSLKNTHPAYVIYSMEGEVMGYDAYQQPNSHGYSFSFSTEARMYCEINLHHPINVGTSGMMNSRVTGVVDNRNTSYICFSQPNINLFGI